MVLYQVTIFALVYQLRSNDPYYWILTVKSWVYYSIVPFQLAGTLLTGVIAQVLVCTGF